MGKLLNRLQADRADARFKTSMGRTFKLKAELLTYVLGELSRQKDKDHSDKVVQAIVAKVKKNLEDALRIKYTDDLHTEVCIIAEYLPLEFTEAQLQRTIEGLIRANPEAKMGQIMGLLKQASQVTPFSYDGKMASTIVRGLL